MLNNNDLNTWGKEQGFTAKKLHSENGVMFLKKKDTKTAFTIYTTCNDRDNYLEIAFNPDNTKATSVFHNLKATHKLATPDARHKWPRIGIKSENVFFDSELQQSLIFIGKD